MKKQTKRIRQNPSIRKGTNESGATFCPLPIAAINNWIKSGNLLNDLKPNFSNDAISNRPSKLLLWKRGNWEKSVSNVEWQKSFYDRKKFLLIWKRNHKNCNLNSLPLVKHQTNRWIIKKEWNRYRSNVWASEWIAIRLKSISFI